MAENEQDPLEHFFLTRNPNPHRIGCPSQVVLQSVARHKLDVPREVFAHLTKCSECFVDVRAYRLRFEQIAQRNKRILRMTIAAMLSLVAAGIVGWYSFKHQNQSFQAAMLNFATSIDRSIGSEQRTVPGAIQTYPQRVLLITMSLPSGSEDGPYEFQVVSPDEKTTLIQSQSKAQIANGLTTITQKVDLSRLEPGLYIARVKHPPFGQWREVPIRIE